MNNDNAKIRNYPDFVKVDSSKIDKILKEQKKKYELNEIIAILQTLHAVTGGIKFFEGEDRFRFRQENATVQLAEEQGELLKQHCLKDQEVYDPLDNV